MKNPGIIIPTATFILANPLSQTRNKSRLELKKNPLNVDDPPTFRNYPEKLILLEEADRAEWRQYERNR